MRACMLILSELSYSLTGRRLSFKRDRLVNSSFPAKVKVATGGWIHLRALTQGKSYFLYKLNLSALLAYKLSHVLFFKDICLRKHDYFSLMFLQFGLMGWIETSWGWFWLIGPWLKHLFSTNTKSNFQDLEKGWIWRAWCFKIRIKTMISTLHT